ncbi:hypothetical protein L1887_47619 [Cichorium endivia]|nr:hypothetical protein L1887_47619 [Cichorium endivia]
MRGWCGVKGVACDWVAPTEDRHELRCCRDGQLRWTELGGSDECLPLSERRAVHKAENQICRSLRASRRRPSSLRAKIKLQTIISPPSRSDNKGLRVLATRVVGHVLDSWIHALAFRIAAISDRTSLFRPRIKSNGHRLARERVLHRAAARTVLRQRSIRTERTSDRASSSRYHAVTIYSRGMKVSWQGSSTQQQHSPQRGMPCLCLQRMAGAGFEFAPIPAGGPGRLLSSCTSICTFALGLIGKAL